MTTKTKKKAKTTKTKKKTVVNGWKSVKIEVDGVFHPGLAKVVARGVIVAPVEMVQVAIEDEVAMIRKFRASELKIVSVQPLNPSWTDRNGVLRFRRNYGKIVHKGFVRARHDDSRYTIGKWRKEKVDLDPNRSCSYGLHFFKNKEAARNY